MSRFDTDSDLNERTSGQFIRQRTWFLLDPVGGGAHSIVKEIQRQMRGAKEKGKGRRVRVGRLTLMSTTFLGGEPKPKHRRGPRPAPASRLFPISFNSPTDPPPLPLPLLSSASSSVAFSLILTMSSSTVLAHYVPSLVTSRSTS